MSARFTPFTGDTNGELKYYDQIIRIFLRLVPGSGEGLGNLINKMRTRGVSVNPFPKYLTEHEFIELQKASKNAVSRFHLTRRKK